MKIELNNFIFKLPLRGNVDITMNDGAELSKDEFEKLQEISEQLINLNIASIVVVKK